MERKKGIQLNQAFGAVLTLVLVAILVIIAIFIFVTLTGSISNTNTVSSENETLDAVTEVSNTRLAGGSNCNAAAFVISEMRLENESIIANNIGAGNFSVDASGNVQFVGNNAFDTATYNNTGWNATYTSTFGSGACNASEDMVTEFSNYTSLIGLVGTIIFLGLVIGVLVAAFAFSGRRV